MLAQDVQDTLDEALAFTGLDAVKLKQRPRRLSDNGPSCIAADMAKYLDNSGMTHTRGRPYHPQTQGKLNTLAMRRTMHARNRVQSLALMSRSVSSLSQPGAGKVLTTYTLESACA